MINLDKSVLEKSFKNVLSTSFDIREGEYTRTFFMTFYIFLIISANLILKPTVISLFLSEFGIEQLPIAFIFVAVFAAGVITFYSYSLTVASIKVIIKRTLFYSNISFLLFWILLEINFLSGWVLYLFYIWVAVFSVLSASQFWIFANLIFNSREAKRLFGIIGAGAIGGGIFGGYLTSILAELIGSENLILISVFLLSLCIPIVNFLWKENLVHFQSNIKQKKATRLFESHPIKLIQSSKHLTYLALIVGVSVIVARLVEFQFSAVASREILNEDELTSFFGFWFSNMNIISLLIQLFLTRRIVGMFGVGTSLFFLPAGIFIGTFAIFISPHLWAAILIRLSDGSLKQSINKSGMELLALPVPAEIKNQTKSYIDIFVDSIATGIGGFILIILSSGFDISIRYISFGTLILLLIWFYIIIQVKKEYLNSFKIKLEQNKNHSQKSFDISNESVIGGIIKILQNGSDKQILHTLKTIREIQNDAFLPALEKLINHPISEIQLETLRNLYFYKSHSYNSEIENLINDPNEEVREEAFHYLFEHAPQDSIELMEKYIFHEDKKIANSALVSLAIEIKDNIYLKEKFNLDQLVHEKLENIKQKKYADSEDEKITIAKVIAIANLHSYLNDFKDLLNDEFTTVVNTSISSLSYLLLPEFIPLLINKLENSETSKCAINSLKIYGESALVELENKLLRAATNKQTKLNIIEILGGIGSRNSVNILFDALEREDYNLQKEILKSLNSLKQNYPQLKFDWDRVLNKLYNEIKLELEIITSIYLQTQIEIEESNDNKTDKALLLARKSLITILESRLDVGLERIFRLLGLKYPPQDMIKIYNSIQSSKEEMRANAVDFLDNLLEMNLKKMILPIVELKISEKLSAEILKQYKLKIPDETECFEDLLNSNDNKLILAAIKVIVLSKMYQLLPKIKMLKENDSDLGSAIDKIILELKD
ncbi:MAG: hypothetical protein H6612_06955 [Ignavibacteriales bacterium]|nr:hypothetical protein [Ignavibacteriales bacterium]